MHACFNPTVSKTNQNTIKDAVKFVSGVVKSYFSFAKPVDLYVYTNQAGEEKVSLTGETYESGVILCKLLSSAVDKEEAINFLVHELNHAKRNELFSTEKHPTLFNWMLLEGLAQAFEVQVASDLDLDWQKFMIPETADDLRMISGLKTILQIGQAVDSWNYYDWFYNTDGLADLPVNFAYQIGRFLVSKYCKKHRITASQALMISNQDFLKFARGGCMRKIILGRLKDDAIACAKIRQALQESEHILQKLNLDASGDLIFVSQHTTDSSLGIDFMRDRNVIIFFVQVSTPPSHQAMVATIVQAILMQSMKSSVGNKFLSDLFRTGVATYYAFREAGLTTLLTLSKDVYDEHVPLARQIMANELTYDEEHWFSHRGKDLPKIWCLGAKNVAQIVEEKNISAFDVAIAQVERQLLAGKK